jgi:hypothetical protein
MSETISEEFNQLCVNCLVKASVRLFSNPGDPINLMRLLTLHNFNKSDVVRVVRGDKEIYIPAEGELQIMLKPDEPWPHVEKIKC